MALTSRLPARKTHTSLQAQHNPRRSGSGTAIGGSGGQVDLPGFVMLRRPTNELAGAQLALPAHAGMLALPAPAGVPPAAPAAPGAQLALPAQSWEPPAAGPAPMPAMMPPTLAAMQQIVSTDHGFHLPVPSSQVAVQPPTQLGVWRTDAVGEEVEGGSLLQAVDGGILLAGDGSAAALAGNAAPEVGAESAAHAAPSTAAEVGAESAGGAAPAAAEVGADSASDAAQATAAVGDGLAAAKGTTDMLSVMRAVIAKKPIYTAEEVAAKEEAKAKKAAAKAKAHAKSATTKLAKEATKELAEASTEKLAKVATKTAAKKKLAEASTEKLAKAVTTTPDKAATNPCMKKPAASPANPCMRKPAASPAHTPLKRARLMCKSRDLGVALTPTPVSKMPASPAKAAWEVALGGFPGKPTSKVASIHLETLGIRIFTDMKKQAWRVQRISVSDTDKAYSFKVDAVESWERLRNDVKAVAESIGKA